MPFSNTHPALGLKLKRGGQRGKDLEILDAATGKPVALILESPLAEALAQLWLTSPDLLWGILRASSHLNCEDPAAGRSTPEARKICKLLREVFEQATARSPQK